MLELPPTLPRTQDAMPVPDPLPPPLPHADDNHLSSGLLPTPDDLSIANTTGADPDTPRAATTTAAGVTVNTTSAQPLQPEQQGQVPVQQVKKRRLYSSHPRDKGIACARFLRTGQCPVHNCPYMHVTPSTRLPVPQAVCGYYLRARCLREHCPFYHLPQSRLEALMASGAKDYSPLDGVPVRDPLETVKQGAQLLSAAELTGGRPTVSPPMIHKALKSEPTAPAVPGAAAPPLPYGFPGAAAPMTMPFITVPSAQQNQAAWTLPTGTHIVQSPAPPQFLELLQQPPNMSAQPQPAPHQLPPSCVTAYPTPFGPQHAWVPAASAMSHGFPQPQPHPHLHSYHHHHYLHQHAHTEPASPPPTALMQPTPVHPHAAGAYASAPFAPMIAPPSFHYGAPDAPPSVSYSIAQSAPAPQPHPMFMPPVAAFPGHPGGWAS